jgi:CxxC motif-containing protein (DUF1111 family)
VNHIANIVLVCGLAFGQAAFAQGWGEPHLPILERTDEEQTRIREVTRLTTDFSAAEQFETHPAGAATKFKALGENAFSFPSANMAFEDELDFKVGNGFFKKLWVSAPASTQSSDGLGPLYNARACQSCHIKDGRGHPPMDANDTGVSMFLRVSIPKEASDLDAETLAFLANAPEPTYGTQLQDKSVAGVPHEGRMQVTYSSVDITLGDGTTVTLRKPTYSVVDPAYGPLHPRAQFSPRVTPQMIGLGLLEAIPEADILAFADPDDDNADGISGRANKVWSSTHGQWMLGRFGLKAGSPSIRAQSAAAFAGDLGLSTPEHPDHWGDCTPTQVACRTAPDGRGGHVEQLEVPTKVMDLVTLYSRNLAVPARRDVDDPAVLRGKELFYDAGCIACHQPKFVTHRLEGQAEQSFQLIWPYSDMLLHDMGEGLADNRPEWNATGREWRTAPLWGLGMTQTVSGHSFFLHDGRARSLLEAVLWHGGEAETARETVRMMNAQDRQDLIRFLESL